MESAFSDLWEAAKLAGPFATLAALLMYYMERKDRLVERTAREKIQDKFEGLQERVLTTTINATAAIKESQEVAKQLLSRGP